jgi:C4-type Zn-finger protein
MTERVEDLERRVAALEKKFEGTLRDAACPKCRELALRVVSEKHAMGPFGTAGRVRIGVFKCETCGFQIERQITS